MTGHDFMRLLKAPEVFEIQFCRITGVRATVFARLSTLLQAPPRPDEVGQSMLDVVRTLCIFAAQLPTFTHKTRRLPSIAAAVRDALVAAREPSTLIFRQLPQACGLNPFPIEGIVGEQAVDDFVVVLKAALEELKAAYPELLSRIKADVATSFDYPGTFDSVRRRLSDVSARLMQGLSEPRLKGLCLRLADRNLADEEWLESLGSFVCSKPPSKWLDVDAEHFREELDRLAQQYRRVEATATAFSNAGGSSLRVAVTLSDGTDIERVVHLDKHEEAQALGVEDAVTALLAAHARVGIAAVTRAIWKELSRTLISRAGSPANQQELENAV